MRVRYVGESFGVFGLTNGKVYKCLGVEIDGLLRIIDDEGEDYLYSSIRPAPMDGSSPGGRWEIVKDDDKGTLTKLFNEINKKEVNG